MKSARKSKYLIVMTHSKSINSMCTLNRKHLFISIWFCLIRVTNMETWNAKRVYCDNVNSSIKRRKNLVFISRRKFRRLFCVFLLLVSKQCLKEVWDFPNNQKCPFCTLASKPNLTLTLALHLNILQSFTYKSLSDNWYFYLHARNMRSDVDGLTHTKQLLNLFSIVYIFYKIP